MTAAEKREKIAAKYRTIIGRNIYSQPRRDYCYKAYKDGKYYSDCSSSISYTYQECGFGFGILTTASMYTSKKFEDVPVKIVKGQIQTPGVLRVGDMLLFAGTDNSRKYAGYVGHVEMVGEITANGKVWLYGHGSGNPKRHDMIGYCRTRYNTKTSTPIGNKGLIKVRRFIRDDGIAPYDPAKTVTVTGASVWVRNGPGKTYTAIGIAHKGDTLPLRGEQMYGWWPVVYKCQCAWISTKYAEVG